jgi:uncharacterized membrane protein
MVRVHFTRHPRQLTAVFSAVAILVSLAAFGGCGISSARTPPAPTSRPAVTFADAGVVASRAAEYAGAAVMPFNPVVGSILAGVGMAGVAACEALRQRRRVRKLSAPWDGLIDRRRPRDVWTAQQRHLSLSGRFPAPNGDAA